MITLLALIITVLPFLGLIYYELRKAKKKHVKIFFLRDIDPRARLIEARIRYLKQRRRFRGRIHY